MDRERACWRILHIGKSVADSMHVADVLAREGGGAFELVQAFSVAEGLERLEDGHIDVVLADLTFPDGDDTEGFQALCGEVEGVPIVIMTGLDDHDFGARMVQMGAQDYLIKSQIEGGVLLRALRHAVERHRTETELRAARVAALDAARAKTEFLSSMSHEIRTPMNSILGMADLLMETGLSEEQQSYVTVFRRAGEALLELINGVLDISKLESGALQLEPEEFDLQGLLEATMEILAYPAHKKRLTLACEILPGTPVCVEGDPAMTRQILVNLVGNAIKFTEQGEVVVSVGRAPGSDEPGHLQFAITDTGIGIPREQLSYIFERFRQGDGSVRRRYGGSGLGLNLSMGLAHLMGGRIRVESEAGQGSTFYFTAKFGLPNRREPERPLAPDTPGAQPLRRALVADDSATERRILRNILVRRGYAVHEVSTGSEAVAELDRNASLSVGFDAIFIDCRMPESGGFEVVRALRASGTAVDHSFMMLTSDHHPGDVSECERLGLRGFLLKPLKATQIHDLLAELENGAARQRGQGEIESPFERAPRPLRILLADDSADNRALILAYLRDQPHTVEAVEDGQLAFERFRARSFDLVLMDMQMPAMDGYSSCRAIRRWEREHGRVPTPILALTAYAFPEERARSFEVGCVAHLTKPIRKRLLLEALAAHAPSAPADEGTRGEGKEAADRGVAQLSSESRTAGADGPVERAPICVEVDEDIRDLVDGFLENRHRDVRRLSESIEAGDFETVRVLGHNMKGVGRNYGFDQISEIGAALEQAGKSLARAEAVKRTRELEDFLDRVEVA